MRPQDEFVSLRKRDWEELDRLVSAHAGFQDLDGPSISRAASLYRALCADVTRGRTAGYTPDLQSYLDGIAARAHRSLYGAPPFRMPALLRIFTHDFPVTLRRNWRFFLLSCALFLLPWGVGMVIALLSPEHATSILPSSTLEGMAHDYSDSFDGRSGAVNTGMAGFYVYNNVGIAFRCFATGIFFGLGSVFFLVYNGLVIGTVTGYVMYAGFGSNIWTFMCGHAPFEITAILISGAAGLRMGHALIDTHGLTRIASLRKSSTEIAHLVIGAAAMLVIAALVEGFWSPSAVPPPGKWAASGLFAIAVVAYLALAGRTRLTHSEQSAGARLAGAR